jgi:hypothetical protein
MYMRILAIVIAGLGWTQILKAQEAKAKPGDGAIEKTEDSFHRLTERADPTTRPADNTMVDADGIRETLRGVTQAALTQNGLDSLIGRFAAADRSRMSRNKQVIDNHPVLDGRIAQFRKDWQARYNQEFKINDKDAVYGAAFASIKQGYEPEGARLAGEKIGPNENPLTAPHDEIRNRDQKVATVSIASSDTAPAMDVPMVLESTGWKIDVPDTYSTQQMHDALLSQITYLDQHRDQLPANVNEASRVVTQRILMAVLNVESPRLTNTNQALPSEPGQSPAADRVLDPNAVK